MRRRAGRPRRSEARRTPNGRLSRAGALPLGPTQELLRRRQALVGSDGSLALAESPLGVLLARDRITAEEREAGNRFAWLYRLSIGRPHLSASDPTKPQEQAGAAPATPPLGAGKLAWLTARTADFNAARAELKTEGDRVHALVVEIAVFQRFPAWMGQDRPLSAEESQDLRQLQAGLRLLARRFGFTLANGRPHRRDAG